MVMWFGCRVNAFGTTENAFFCAFITLRSQFHLHHRSQRALMETMSKITPYLDLSFNVLRCRPQQAVTPAAFEQGIWVCPTTMQNCANSQWHRLLLSRGFECVLPQCRTVPTVSDTGCFWAGDLSVSYHDAELCQQSVTPAAFEQGIWVCPTMMQNCANSQWHRLLLSKGFECVLPRCRAVATISDTGCSVCPTTMWLRYNIL